MDSHGNRGIKMAGRPKKKPEYDPELQFNHFLQELRDAYEEADFLRSLADELNISLLKLRKLLLLPMHSPQTYVQKSMLCTVREKRFRRL